MIRPGFVTIPEVLRVIRSRIDDDDFRILSQVRNGEQLEQDALDRIALESLEAALHRGEVAVYVMNGGTIYRIPHEDLEQLIQEGWETWVAGGRVEDATRKGKDFASDRVNRDSATSIYHGCRPLVAETDLDWWLGPAPETPITKTGAPGRPSSMGIVMVEFERRRAGEQCKSSRQAEANTLAAWLKETHPNMPKLSAKSIRNKLPHDFQPYKASK